MIQINLTQQAEFKNDRFVVKKLFDSPEAKYVLFCFKGGQKLREHKTSSAISVQFLSGRANFMVEGDSHDAGAGDFFLLEPERLHAIEAVEDTVVLLTLTPSPSMHTLLKL